MRFFGKKFPFSRQKFLMIFFSHRPFLSQIFPMFAMLNVIYLTLSSHEKTPFFTLLILSRASDNTTSLNIGGTNAWAVPPPQIFWGAVPPAPLGLRPCIGRIVDTHLHFFIKQRSMPMVCRLCNDVGQ